MTSTIDANSENFTFLVLVFDENGAGEFKEVNI